MTQHATVLVGEPVRRTAEIEEFTNAVFIHPVAAWLVPKFARIGITANAVSLAGMAFGILAGVCYHYYRYAPAAVAGFLLMVAWHIMDGADGQLARLTRTQSEIGKVLDGICDYVTFASVYIGLAASLAPEHGMWVLALIAAAGLCHAVQAAAYEAQRQDYEVWGYGKRVSAPAKSVAGSASPLRQALRRLDGIYIALQALTDGAGEASRARLAASFGHAPEQDAAVRRRYRETFAPAVRRWSMLSANYRTAAIFVFALLRAPLGYFAFEIVALSITTALLLRGQRRRHARFVSSLAQLP